MRIVHKYRLTRNKFVLLLKFFHTFCIRCNILYYKMSIILFAFKLNQKGLERGMINLQNNIMKSFGWVNGNYFNDLKLIQSTVGRLYIGDLSYFELISKLKRTGTLSCRSKVKREPTGIIF